MLKKFKNLWKSIQDSNFHLFESTHSFNFQSTRSFLNIGSYLINNDLKRKIINEHIDWVKKLKKEGINIKSGFLVDELKRPGAGGLLILEINNYENALKIIKNDPMIKNDLVEWKLNEWVDSNK